MKDLCSLASLHNRNVRHRHLRSVVRCRIRLYCFIFRGAGRVHSLFLYLLMSGACLLCAFYGALFICRIIMYIFTLVREGLMAVEYK